MKDKVSGDLIKRLWKIEKRHCAQCWAPMVYLERENGSATLTCPHECEPGGHVSARYVKEMRNRDHALAWDAAKNHPDLAREDGVIIKNTEEVQTMLSVIADRRLADYENEAMIRKGLDPNSLDDLQKFSAEWGIPLSTINQRRLDDANQGINR